MEARCVGIDKKEGTGERSRKETHLLTQHRKGVYQQIDKRADAVVDLLHAMCSEERVRNVAELSLHPVCRRGHDSLYKAIRDAGMTSQKRPHLAARVLPQPKERAYWLVSTDTTPCPRAWSWTLPERGSIYAPRAVPGRAPITIGYTFSTVAVHPEREADAPIWALPVACERVRAEASPVLVGAAQLQALMSDPEMPWHGQQKALVVHVADSTYSQKAFVPAAAHPDLVHVLCVRTNRLFYAPASRLLPPARSAPSLRPALPLERPGNLVTTRPDGGMGAGRTGPLSLRAGARLAHHVDARSC